MSKRSIVQCLVCLCQHTKLMCTVKQSAKLRCWQCVQISSRYNTTSVLAPSEATLGRVLTIHPIVELQSRLCTSVISSVSSAAVLTLEHRKVEGQFVRQSRLISLTRSSAYSACEAWYERTLMHTVISVVHSCPQVQCMCTAFPAVRYKGVLHNRLQAHEFLSPQVCNKAIMSCRSVRELHVLKHLVTRWPTLLVLAKQASAGMALKLMMRCYSRYR